MQKSLRVAVVVMTCLVIGYLSEMEARESFSAWFPTLIKPVFCPPNWVFVPVWAVLYCMIGVSGGMIWNRLETDAENIKKAFRVFIVQLALSALWSYLFFSLHNIFLALIEIILLWLLIFETYTQFKKIDKTAGILFVPYLVWIGFIVILNGSIWWLNK